MTKKMKSEINRLTTQKNNGTISDDDLVLLKDYMALISKED